MGRITVEMSCMVNGDTASRKIILDFDDADFRMVEVSDDFGAAIGECIQSLSRAGEMSGSAVDAEIVAPAIARTMFEEHHDRMERVVQFKQAARDLREAVFEEIQEMSEWPAQPISACTRGKDENDR